MPAMDNTANVDAKVPVVNKDHSNVPTAVPVLKRSANELTATLIVDVEGPIKHPVVKVKDSSDKGAKTE